MKKNNQLFKMNVSQRDTVSKHQVQHLQTQPNFSVSDLFDYIAFHTLCVYLLVKNLDL